MDFLEIFREGKRRGASDIILTAGETPYYRIHGALWTDETDIPLTAEDSRKLLFALLRDEQKVRLETDKELDFSINIRGVQRYRGNIFFQRGTMGAAFRAVPDDPPALSDLGLPNVLSELAMAVQGLMLVTGPTGSGKSTTCAAMIDEINRKRKVHIVTIEDPIEYIHPNKKSVIEQREVGEDTLSFQRALRQALRQDPDVILVGEMRDLETIQTAITAAETGHLVLATLHTNDCVQTIDRMIDVFPAGQQPQVRNQLASSLLGIFNQRLLPRTDRIGRIVAGELLTATTAVRSLIREEKNHQIYSQIETGAQHGMFTMDQSLKDLYTKGMISMEEVRRRVRNPREAEALVR